MCNDNSHIIIHEGRRTQRRRIAINLISKFEFVSSLGDPTKIIRRPKVGRKIEEKKRRKEEKGGNGNFPAKSTSI